MEKHQQTTCLRDVLQGTNKRDKNCLRIDKVFLEHRWLLDLRTGETNNPG